MSDRAAAVRMDEVTAHALPHLQPVLSTHAARFRPAAVRLHVGETGFAPRDQANHNPVGIIQDRLRARFEPVRHHDPDTGPVEDALEAEDDAARHDVGEPHAEMLAQIRAEAFAAGLAEGRKAAEHEAGIRMLTLDRLAERFAAARAIEPAEAEAALRQAALHLAIEVLGDAPELVRETLSARVGKAARWFAQALGVVELRLNPADLAALEGRVEWPRALLVRADPEVQSGAFVIQSAETCVSDSIADRLGRLEAALRGGSGDGEA